LEYVTNITEFLSATVLNATGISFLLSMICPSCLMFDAHRGHTVAKIEEGAKDLRSRINQAAKEGTLKF